MNSNGTARRKGGFEFSFKEAETQVRFRFAQPPPARASSPADGAQQPAKKYRWPLLPGLSACRVFAEILCPISHGMTGLQCVPLLVAEGLQYSIMSDWQSLTVVKLRAELQKRGLNTKGRKADLVARLDGAEDEGDSSESTSSSFSDGSQISSSSNSSSSSDEEEPPASLLGKRKKPESAVAVSPQKKIKKKEAILDEASQSSLDGASDPLGLAELFTDGGECWLPWLKETIESQPQVETFMGLSRARGIVPVRELTFQALKPNRPADWKVVVFGQGPYKRVESATGISFFDNAFDHWDDSLFGRTLSMRCIMKAALVWKHGIERDTRVAELRKLLKKHQIVQPPQWFQSMLTQGVLLISAALTENHDGGMSTAKHTTFWKPVVHQIVRAILSEKADKGGEGVVFAWWGSHAKALRAFVDKIAAEFPDVPVRHIQHYNPAARKEEFCLGNHFKDLNNVLEELEMSPIDWLPSEGWDSRLQDQSRQGDVARMGDFISQTQNLHKMYLDRLQGVADEVAEDLGTLEGIMELPVVTLLEALATVYSHADENGHVKKALRFADAAVQKDSCSLSKDEVAAIYLYTSGSTFYKELNAALRDPKRTRTHIYFRYIRLFLSALANIKAVGETKALWRGVALDLRSQYRKGAKIVWWGVSSCSSDKSIAQNFSGGAKVRMLFEVHSASASPIQVFSAFSEEEEYIIAPGTQLEVVSVVAQKGLYHVKMVELEGASRIA